MATDIERLTITVPRQMAAALHDAVAEGRYASTSEVVREALRQWQHERDDEHHQLERLRAAIQAGDAGGDSIPADKLFAELRKIVDKHRTPV